VELKRVCPAARVVEYDLNLDWLSRTRVELKHAMARRSWVFLISPSRTTLELKQLVSSARLADVENIYVLSRTRVELNLLIRFIRVVRELSVDWLSQTRVDLKQ
jgi:hypothetical protein